MGYSAYKKSEPLRSNLALMLKNGHCSATIITLAEAKAECRPNENMEYGIAQCAAQLYGAKLFNEKAGKQIPFLYGCATDGVEWTADAVAVC